MYFDQSVLFFFFMVSTHVEYIKIKNRSIWLMCCCCFFSLLSLCWMAQQIIELFLETIYNDQMIDNKWFYVSNLLWPHRASHKANTSSHTIDSINSIRISIEHTSTININEEKKSDASTKIITINKKKRKCCLTNLFRVEYLQSVYMKRPGRLSEFQAVISISVWLVSL